MGRTDSPASFIIVGGGPAAAATAKALVAGGKKVLVIDAGLSLEPEREAARGRMCETDPAGWQPEDISLTRFSTSDDRGPNYKQLFGSDFTFRNDGVLELHTDPNVGARPSYAIGGLSNVWGSGLLSYTESDLAGWPINLTDLQAGYRAVLDFLPYAAEEDELARHYPLYREPDGPLIRTRAGEELLDRLRRHSRALSQRGLIFGASRLGVRVGHPAPSHGCVYCRHCLDGCPYGHIYNAADTIGELHRSGVIEYRAGLHVDRVIEGDGEVTVEASALPDGASVSLRAERVFIAAGVVSTTVILQRSELLPQRSEILDSQALYLPFAWLGRIGDTGREPGQTLAQAALVLDEGTANSKPVHFSLYTYSDGLSERARQTRPRLSLMLGPMLEGILRRLVVGIGFLHSDDSDRVASTWDHSSGAVRLDAVPNVRRDETVARVQRSVLRSLGRVGLVPLSPLAQVAPAGGGYHYGGSVPMRERPGFGESDTFGRPSGARLVHVVDASCFPTVPGGSITLSAMANAHRIASAVAAEKP